MAQNTAGSQGRYDSRETALRSILFLALMLFYFITTTPFAPVGGVSAIDPQGANPNPLNQLVAVALFIGFGLYALWHPLGRAMAFQPRGLLIPLLLWFALVSAVSANPDIALRKLVLAAMTCLDASILLLLPRSERHFARLILLATAIMLFVAYAGVVLLPSRAIHQATELIEPEHAGLWHGQFPHKNEAAAVMVLAFLIALYTFRAGLRIASLVVMGLSAVFLAHTGGKSAIGYLPATLAVAWIFERWRWTRLLIALGGPILFNVVAIGSALSPSVSDLLEAVGIDPTFTNRTDIWRLALEAISRHPLLGYGFQGFWQTDDLFYSRGAEQTWAVQAFNGHNSWIDLVLTTGLPSLLVVIVWLVILPVRDLRRAERMGNDPALNRLFIRIWLYGLFQSCMESIFFQSGSPIWFVFAFAVFGLRLQGSALVETDPNRAGGFARRLDAGGSRATEPVSVVTIR